MVMKRSSINVKVNEKLKSNAVEVLNYLGLSLTDAIRIYLNQIVLNNGIPFDVKLHKYSNETIAAIERERISSKRSFRQCQS